LPIYLMGAEVINTTPIVRLSESRSSPVLGERIISVAWQTRVRDSLADATG